MNIDQKNKIIIISSPSGAGKTTLCKLLLKKMRNINLSISYTSRNKRLNEINGKDYFFVTKEKFNQLKNKNFFIETAINFGNHYGSPYKNLKTENPYNTYINFGLPPGPISYVGYKTIELIFEDYKTDYLFYFYNSHENKHIFSKNYKDHLKRLNEYRSKK